MKLALNRLMSGNQLALRLMASTLRTLVCGLVVAMVFSRERYGLIVSSAITNTPKDRLSPILIPLPNTMSFLSTMLVSLGGNHFSAGPLRTLMASMGNADAIVRR